jgi:hypothetical protein
VESVLAPAPRSLHSVATTAGLVARSARSGTTDSDQAPAGAGPSRITPRQGSSVLLLDCWTIVTARRMDLYRASVVQRSPLHLRAPW